jgi:hypothetical protein
MFSVYVAAELSAFPNNSSHIIVNTMLHRARNANRPAEVTSCLAIYRYDTQSQ